MKTTNPTKSETAMMLFCDITNPDPQADYGKSDKQNQTSTEPAVNVFKFVTVVVSPSTALIAAMVLLDAAAPDPANGKKLVALTAVIKLLAVALNNVSAPVTPSVPVSVVDPTKATDVFIRVAVT